MSKHNIDKSYVRNIRTILEGEVEEAEVIMAARGFSKEFQDMIQKVGRLANEQVGPVVDQIRLTYGPEMAESFQNTVRDQMDAVLNAIASAKDTLDNLVIDITNGGIPTGGTDMDSDEFGSEEGGDMDVSGDLDVDLGDDSDFGDEADFGDDEGGFADEFGAEEPIGRAALESKRALEHKIIEMRARLEQERKIIEQKLSKKK